jgi:riboflavin-specific deaminase-like protein
VDPAAAVWEVILAAARHAADAARTPPGPPLGLTWAGELHAGDHPGQSVLVWQAAQGWVSQLSPDDARAAALDLYLPVCSASPARPLTLGHLGQSLDGFIATHAGDSRWVTGQENILHLHRLRALSDAVVVGALTVSADDPQLTTRHVPGPSPLRVVFDPARRLDDSYGVFSDEAAHTLYACARALVRPGETRVGTAEVLGLDEDERGSLAAGLIRHLRERGCARVLVEGGGVTVSRFLEAGLLQRLHLTVAPLLIGSGRPAIRLSPPSTLGACRRPPYRVFRMGGDILFDCDLTSDDRPEAVGAHLPSVSRII